MDPDQDRHFVGPDQNVGPDLVPYCLQRISADEKVTTSKEKSLWPTDLAQHFESETRYLNTGNECFCELKDDI